MSSTSNTNNNAEILKSVLHNLSGALVYTEPTNIETNKKLWNQYAKNWNSNNNASNANKGNANNTSNNDDNKSTPPPSEWVVKMASQVNRTANDLPFIGCEWS